MRYVQVEGWGGESWNADVTGVAVDSGGLVYVLQRGAAPVSVFHPDGSRMANWGEGLFSERPHLISVDSHGQIYVADDGGHKVYVFGQNGSLFKTIGSGAPSVTGYSTSATSQEDAFDAMAGGPPFNRPTKAVADASGEIFVSDGYRNCRIHRFSAAGKLVKSWGGPGPNSGSFVIPHSVTLDMQGRVYVCDRENDRIQIFSKDGHVIGAWLDVQRPTDLAFDRDGLAYVCELPRGPTDIKSWRLGRAESELPGRVSVRSKDGRVLGEVSGFEFLAPHAIAVDGMGSIYVSEVPASFFAYTGRAPKDHCCLRKFVPL